MYYRVFMLELSKLQVFLYLFLQNQWFHITSTYACIINWIPQNFKLYLIQFVSSESNDRAHEMSSISNQTYLTDSCMYTHINYFQLEKREHGFMNNLIHENIPYAPSMIYRIAGNFHLDKIFVFSPPALMDEILIPDFLSLVDDYLWWSLPHEPKFTSWIFFAILYRLGKIFVQYTQSR